MRACRWAKGDGEVVLKMKEIGINKEGGRGRGGE